jgi:hypothetical protein
MRDRPGMDRCVMIKGHQDVTREQWRARAAGCEQHRIPAPFRSDHSLPLDGPLTRAALDAWGTVCALVEVGGPSRVRAELVGQPARAWAGSSRAAVAG